MGIARAAFVCFGEVNTPKEIILRKSRAAKLKLEEKGLDLIAVDYVSDDPEGRDVAFALDALAGQDFDLLIVCIAGWIPSHAVISVIRDYRHKPMVLWGLCGWTEGVRLVTTADQAGTSALRKPMEDMGFRFLYVYDTVGGSGSVGRIVDYAKAARAAALLCKARVGMMGYRDMNLYGTLHDGISLRGKLGVEIECFEMLDMVQRKEKIGSDDITRIRERIYARWKFVKPPDPETLDRGIAYYLALASKIRERNYLAVSLLDVDGMKKLLNFPPAMIFMLLDQELGVCTIPENDCLGSVTQLMVRFVTGQVAAYLEFYEFMEDRVLMGVPDFIPAETTDGQVTVVPSKFGQLGEGILNVSKMKTGNVTLCRLTYSGGGYALHMTTGKAETPRKWEEAGWSQPAPQLPGLEVLLDEPVERFAAHVMSQHYIVSYGDCTNAMKYLCGILDIPIID